MEDDTDLPPERETKDFQFRQLKKIRLFNPPQEVPKDRSNLLAISNKYGLLFAGGSPGLKIFHTKDVLVTNQTGEDPNHIAAGPPGITVPMKHPTHHVALSCDSLTLSICVASSEFGTFISFYDVRTLLNEAIPQKRPFAYYKLTKDGNVVVTDLKWNPAIPTMVATCLSDGSISVLQVADAVTPYATLPASLGVTSVCWSPKGKQLAVGKQNGTVVQFLPNLQEKKVIPCPSFYDSENPVKVLDVLWVSTYVFAVVYAAADGSLEASPQLVMVLLPKKEDRRGERFLNFMETCYSSCTERNHHFFLSYIDDWEILLGASAASIEVSVIARPPDQAGYELWLLEDASRADLPVTEHSDDTLPMGLVVDYTSQLELFLSEEKILPPTPILLILSTDGVLCPFHMINSQPGAKSLTLPLERLSLEGERQIKTVGTGLASPAPATPPSSTSQISAPPAFSLASASPASSITTGSSPFAVGAPAAASNSAKQANASAFSFQPMQGAGVFGTGGMRPESLAPPGQTALSTTSVIPAPSTVKVNLKDKFSAVDIQQSVPSPNSGVSSISFSPSSKPPAYGDPRTVAAAPFQPQTPVAHTRPSPADVTQVVASTPSGSMQKTARVNPPAAKQTPAQPQLNVAAENQFKQLKESDPILSGIKEEITHFQKELGDLKSRTTKAGFLVGSEAQMRQLRTDSDDLHSFLLEIKETTESLHGDIGSLKTSLLEGFAGVEDSREQNERKQDPRYRHLLYKKPLDPKSEAQMQEIRRLHQYVKFTVQDVNDVLDLEWDRHLEKKKRQKGLIVPERETLFNTLANNREIINQQRQRLNQLVDNLQQLRLYNQTSQWNAPREESSSQSFEVELESMRNALSKTSMDMQSKPMPKLPPKLSPVKQSQLRNFLSKRKTPPVRSLAPASLNRSAFLAPSFFEDLDDVSSTSSLSEAAENEERRVSLQEAERQETPPPEITPIRVPRHAAVARTSSVQPGFVPPSASFGKPQFVPGPVTSTPAVSSIRVIPQGADSTMLATKTVKHGAPSVSAQQAAAAAALRRQIASQVPVSLTESTLQTVPQVVNVKELKGNGPGPNIPTILGPSVPHSAAQVIHQVLATVGSAPAKQVPSAAALKMHPTSVPISSSGIPPPGQGTAQSKPTGQAIPTAESLPIPAPASSAPASAQQAARPFSFAPASSGFSFSNVSSASTSSSSLAATTAGAPQRDSGQPSPFTFGNKPSFSAGSIGSFSFSSLKPAPQVTAASSGDIAVTAPPFQPAAQSTVASPTPGGKLEATPAKQGDGLFQAFSGGETLGSFSGLRVGQVEENTKAVPSTQPAKVPSTTSVFGSPGGFQPSKPGEVSSTTSGSSGPLFGNLQLAGVGPAASLFNPSVSKPSFSFGTPSSTASVGDGSSGNQAPPALAFENLLAPATSTPTHAASTPPAPSTSTSNFAAPSSVASTLAAPSPATSTVLAAASSADSSSTLDVKQVVQTDLPPYEPPAPTLQQQGLLFNTSEGGREQAPTQTPSAGASTAPFAPSIPTAVPAAVTKPDATSVPSIPVTVGSVQSAPNTAAVVNTPGPVSTLAGDTASQTPATPNTTQIMSPPGVPTTQTSAFTQQAATAAPSPAATSTFGQAPGATAAPAPFAQQGSASNPAASTTSGFGTTGFGLAGTGGGAFGQPSFGQAPAFWKTPAASSASSFSFAQSSFGAQPAFGQPPTSTVAASNSGSLFGSVAQTSSSASSFSFAQPSSSGSAPSAGGGGLFSQSSTPAFGQSSGFGQAAPVFGTASSSTTTTPSTGFSFGQPSGFTASSSGSLFGQSQNPTASVFGQPPSSSGGSVFGTNTGAGSGGFFSGLGGKPSQEAANKNPFGAPTSGFGSPSNSNGSSLFGNSGAKSFGFGSSSFGDQKSSGTFSAGGSVASQGFGFTSPTKTGGFGAAPVFGSPPTFGGSPGFGGVPAFGTAPAFASPLGSTGGKVFGEGTAAANTGGFGFGSSNSNTSFGGLASQSTPTFGSLSQQGPGFGGQQSSGFSGFGSGAGAAPSGGNTGFGFGVSNHQSQPALGTHPFLSQGGLQSSRGHSDHENINHTQIQGDRFQMKPQDDVINWRLGKERFLLTDVFVCFGESLTSPRQHLVVAGEAERQKKAATEADSHPSLPICSFHLPQKLQSVCHQGIYFTE
ncbi:nuclear pore complex protein Nup214 [Pelodytes ibericus]